MKILHCFTNKLTNQLLGAVLVEKLSLLQLVEKFSSFYGMRKSTTLFTGTPPPRVLSRAKIIQSTSLKGMWTGIILYPSIYAEIFQVMLSFIFTHQNSVCIFFFLINATCPIPFNLLHAIRPSLKY